MEDFFILSVEDRFIFYAPLHRYARFVQPGQVEELVNKNPNEAYQIILQICPEMETLKQESILIPEGELVNPLFLGLITTRGCNMGCRYCDFPAPKTTSSVMSVETAKVSVDMYLHILASNKHTRGQIEFFGGEPFFMNHIPEFVLSYARNKASGMSIDLQFKVTTNGLLSQEKCEWVADNFDTVVLSLDGFPEIQNRNRPLLNGNESFEKTYFAAKIFSAGSTDLIIRSCISQDSVEKMPEIAGWIIRELNVDKVCFEALSPSAMSGKYGLEPPDPVRFAINYIKSKRLLSKSHIDLVSSGTDISELQNSFCPVGKDALIVTPEGRINACYLPEDEWLDQGLDLTIGALVEPPENYFINSDQLQNERAFNSLKPGVCQSCFAKYHCAGGCHVHHSGIRTSSTFDRLCIQTRLILLAELLQRMNGDELVNSFMISTEWQKLSDIHILAVKENLS